MRDWQASPKRKPFGDLTPTLPSLHARSLPSGRDRVHAIAPTRLRERGVRERARSTTAPRASFPDAPLPTLPVSLAPSGVTEGEGNARVAGTARG